ncbi:hypothetical protein SAMN05192575_105263 [Nocardioides alpinus]|uniref:Collagen triple helix repeat-containing protein n=1 Tax=Nocardioides alpinus TaxID=748909 RepID=A0A1I0ZE59_9ACTN|nr:hypothetical protein [Nocardioides alpinus]PKH40653.1 hypothetical protein CXG46_11710 [Nocardioides alpinus]SFB23811.1 hypothetical protein SAMN05192575_105263 [Nocardioides alpinus]
MKINKKTAGLVGAAVLVAALSSTGTAVAGGLITTAQIKDSAVTTGKVKNGTLTLKDFKASERSKLVGAPGAPGATGPMGAIGPAGASASASSVVVQSPTVTVAAYDIGTVIAFCPAGKKVTGGGYFSSIAIAASSQPGTSAVSWGAVINNSDNSIPVDVWAYAVCA